jgi:hypothetical protein
VSTTRSPPISRWKAATTQVTSCRVRYLPVCKVTTSEARAEPPGIREYSRAHGQVRSSLIGGQVYSIKVTTSQNLTQWCCVHWPTAAPGVGATAVVPACARAAPGYWRRVPRGRAEAVRQHPGRHGPGVLLAAATSSSRPACFRWSARAGLVRHSPNPRPPIRPQSGDAAAKQRSPRTGQVPPARRPRPDSGSLRVAGGPRLRGPGPFFPV